MMCSTKRALAPFFPGLLLALIVLLTAACSTAPAGTGAGSTPAPGKNGKTPAPGAPAASPPVQTEPMPQTNTSCPAANTARAAVMRPLALGNHQNLVYISNEVPPHTSSSSGHVRRYDITTGKSLTLVESGLPISQAQVSADGQWVLLLSVPDPRGDRQRSALLQLVRMDGQGLQTLYCFPATIRGSSGMQFQWSVDEQSIVVSMETEDVSETHTTSQIFVLDVASGTLRPLFLDQDDPTYGYRVMSWLDATRFYVIRSGFHPGVDVPLTLYLVNASTATVANPGLQTVLSAPALGREVTLESSDDGTTLFTATCPTLSSGTIAVEPAGGGASQVIFSSGNACAMALHAISANTLFLLVRVSVGTSYQEQVWTMHPDGSDRQMLTTLAGSEVFEMNATSQFPWSTVSRDGTLYALQQGPAADRQSILLGRLRGGNPTVVLTAGNPSSGLDLAGWTTM